jgi:hypothetical protein
MVDKPAFENKYDQNGIATKTQKINPLYLHFVKGRNSSHSHIICNTTEKLRGI